MKTGKKLATDDKKTTERDVNDADYDLAKEYRSIIKPQLDKDELKIYDQVAPLLSSLGRLRPEFMTCIVQYCECVFRLQRFKKEIKGKEYYTVQTKGGEPMVKIHPLMGQINTDNKFLNTLASELGLTPRRTTGIKIDRIVSDEFENI